jgi:putative DNA primase/helicase
MFHEKTAHAAKGQWKGILMHLGVPEAALVNRHGPCPLCGGVDRFRWDNAEGRGTYICSQCGAGDGFKLATEFTGKSFTEVAPEIDKILGNNKFEPDKPKPVITEQQRRDALKAVYVDTKPVQVGDLAHTYLASRHIEELLYPEALRFGHLRDGEGGVRPCMVAMVGRYGEGRFDTMHRTFLRSDGMGKAEMQAPRKMMPGELHDGSCVMLSQWNETGPIGIAEGIETAMSASALFGIPVWSAINSSMLERWLPPKGCDEVVIFGDNDIKFGGQAAAYRLAHKLAVKGHNVTVQLPSMAGQDWADVWSTRARTGFPPDQSVG